MKLTVNTEDVHHAFEIDTANSIFRGLGGLGLRPIVLCCLNDNTWVAATTPEQAKEAFEKIRQEKDKYWEYLPLAYEIYNNLFGSPKTHGEWAKGFNIRGKIIKTLIDND